MKPLMPNHAPHKIKPHSEALRRRLHKMPVPGVIEITGDDWIPSSRWVNLQKMGVFSCRRFEGRFFIFRLSKNDE